MPRLSCKNETTIMKKTFILIAMTAISMQASAQNIDRRDVVVRNNPRVTSVDTLSSFTVGNGHFAFTVDATGLQTFPEEYAQGIPLGTMSDWGWHSFPNTNGYKAEEALQTRNFGRGHDEPYAMEDRQPGRRHDAVAYLRQNPHRLHLGCVGLNLTDTAKVKNVSQQLDMWNGIITSEFFYDGKPFKVQTLCHPEADEIASCVKTDGKVEVLIRIPYPTGNHSDDACDWRTDAPQTVSFELQKSGANAIVKIDSTSYHIDVRWSGEATLQQVDSHTLALSSENGNLDFRVTFSKDGKHRAKLENLTFDNLKLQVAEWWHDYWQTGAIADFSHVSDPRAAELERRVVLSQYLMAVNDGGDIPPQETGLTYNSWFGKFHLEMIWWHQAQFALWGHPEMLERSLKWYLTVENKAREIANRQGFEGVRWMKMTDPSGEEAPSNVGSFLIWQQPHIIHLAELLYRAYDNPAEKQRILTIFAHLIDKTAEMMASFATYDPAVDRFVLKGCIPAQETLKADSTVNPPFELSYWHWGLKTAQTWRERAGKAREQRWDRVISHLSRLAHSPDGLYLAAESAPDTYVNIRYISDHPAVLGAVGILPQNPLTNDDIMRNTLKWILKSWNWNKTWGWDYPMTAMCAARMGKPEEAVDALLMERRTNTYLNNGHNYQDGRLRLYLPGNGGLLTAVAMMLAGWDGTKNPNPGFPPDWDIRWEGLLPLP